jgi:hypothetical protein
LSEDDLILVEDPIPVIVEETEKKGGNSSENQAVIEASAAAITVEAKPEEATLVLSLKDKMLSFGSILNTIDVSK